MSKLMTCLFVFGNIIAIILFIIDYMYAGMWVTAISDILPGIYFIYWVAKYGSGPTIFSSGPFG